MEIIFFSGGNSGDLNIIDLTKQIDKSPTTGQPSKQSCAQRGMSSLPGSSNKQKEQAMADWYSMFAELDPLANPVGNNKDCL